MSKTTKTYSANRVIRVCAYLALLISAGIFLFGGLISWLGWSALSKVVSILDIIGKILLIIGVAIPAHDFTAGKKPVWRVLFWFALIIYVLGCVFGII